VARTPTCSSHSRANGSYTTTLGVAVVTTPHACAGHARGVGQFGHCSHLGPLGVMDTGQRTAIIVHFSFLRESFSDLNFRKLFKHNKFIVNHINFRKIQSKFLLNPLAQVYALGLTKSLFVHYCLVENFQEIKS
jgi:hypothetical protein